MREYVDQLTRQDRVVVVMPHRRPATPLPPARKRGAGLAALALAALLCLPLLGSATPAPVRAPDVAWQQARESEAPPCHLQDTGEPGRPTAPTLYVEPTPHTLRAVPGLDAATGD